LTLVNFSYSTSRELSRSPTAGGATINKKELPPFSASAPRAARGISSTELRPGLQLEKKKGWN
jgi:hypothetical protein